MRSGATSATVRAEAEREGRSLLIEAELVPGGRSRIQVNRQRLPRARDLLGALRVSVFAPDDLELVKGGPAERRATSTTPWSPPRPSATPCAPSSSGCCASATPCCASPAVG